MNKKQDIIFMNFDQILSDRFSKYSKYIIQERALPDVRDGLKPVQRRILYAMHDLRLLHNKPYKKSARVVGEVIGKYHPHGDTSIYDAIVRMSQSWKMNVTLVEMHGNNGSIDDDPAAAMRYTEVRMSKIAESMLNNINENAIKFSPNFDDSEKEPIVLPSLFPNLLVNGAKGIASGFATEMPPHNLQEIIKAIILKINSPNCRLSTILEIVKGPDFPTGGIVIDNKNEIYKALELGSGRIIIRSKFELQTTKRNPAIIITDIPYGVIKAKLIREIDEIRFHNKIYGIKEICDETDRNGLKISINLVENANLNVILTYLLRKTQMQIYYSYNNVVIVNKTPKKLGILSLIDSYIKHQQNVIRKYSKYRYDKQKNRLEIIEGLIKATTEIDKIISIIRNSNNSRDGVIKNLITQLKYTIIQAQAIADLKLYRLSKTERQTYFDEKNKLINSLNFLEKILTNNNELNKYLISKLRKFSSEFSTSRKTKILMEDNFENIEISADKLVKKESIYISISNLGYFKSFSNKTFIANSLATYKLKEEDSLIFISKLSSLSKLIIITNYGRFLCIPAYKFSEAKWSTIGHHLNILTILYAAEKVVTVFKVNKFDENKFIILASKNGKIKKTKLSNFNVKKFNKPVSCFSLGSDDRLIGAQLSNNTKKIILITSNGYVVKYPETIISATGIKSAGIKGMTLKNNTINALVVGEESEVIGILSSRGGVKRIRISNIDPYSRNSKGKLIFTPVKYSPHIVRNSEIVQPQTYYMFAQKNGKHIFNQFKNIIISSSDSGFSGNSIIQNCSILKSLNYENELNKEKNNTFEQKFKNIEEKISNISQLSIDELLSKK